MRACASSPTLLLEIDYLVFEVLFGGRLFVGIYGWEGGVWWVRFFIRWVMETG